MKVLIPIDGSECSEKTLEWATSTLDKGNTQFYIFHVIPSGIPELVTEVFEVEDTLAMLKKAQSFMEGKGATVEKAEYMEGDPAQRICDYADEMNVDQVLMGSHGRTGITKILLGSISSKVMERCKKPVFIYKNVEHNHAAV